MRHRHKVLTAAAWAGAEQRLRELNQELLARGVATEMTPNVIDAIGARVLETRPAGTLSTQEAATVEDAGPRWREWAPPELLRRRVNVEKQLRDFPAAGRMLPTRLGNILRRHEDETGETEVESFIRRRFDDLPASVREEHDDQRTRLDLYCSMVFVMLLVTVVAAVRLGPQHRPAALVAVGVGLMAAALMYRAAVASARAYGGLLVLASRLPAATGPAPGP
jgi:hypothetical protein